MNQDFQMNPFPGIRPFDIHEKYLFFGREEQTAELLTRLRKTRFLAVVGVSGSGKSSLVRAGLLPELHGGTMASAGSSWEVAIMKPGGDPLSNLADALVEAEIHDPEQVDVKSMVRASLSRSGMGLVDTVQQGDLPEKTNLLLVVDQFEEIFRFRRMSGIPDEEAGHFINLLLEASQQTNCNLYVVITMRSDFLGDCAQFRGLAEAVNEGEYIIPRLNRSQRKQAIEGPALVGGREMSNRLVQRLLNDISDDPDQLPILQHALMRTWDYWVKSGCAGPVDLEHYNSTGGMSEALSQHADEIYSDLPSDEHRKITIKIFKSLTEKVSENRGIRRPMQLGELQEICGSTKDNTYYIVNKFRSTGCTFLTPVSGIEINGKSIIDISHESLMRVWRKLRDWVDDEAQSAKIYKRLADTASLYKSGKAGLYRNPDLQIALSWREETVPTKIWADRYYSGFVNAIDFLEKSHNEAVKEETERELARKRELKQARDLAKMQMNLTALFKRAGIVLGILLLACVFFMYKSIANEKKVKLAIQDLAQRSKSQADKFFNLNKTHEGLAWLYDSYKLSEGNENFRKLIINDMEFNLKNIPYISNIEFFDLPSQYIKYSSNSIDLVSISMRGLNHIRYNTDNHIYKYLQESASINNTRMQNIRLIKSDEQNFYFQVNENELINYRIDDSEFVSGYKINVNTRIINASHSKNSPFVYVSYTFENKNIIDVFDAENKNKLHSIEFNEDYNINFIESVNDTSFIVGMMNRDDFLIHNYHIVNGMIKKHRERIFVDCICDSHSISKNHKILSLGLSKKNDSSRRHLMNFLDINSLAVKIASSVHKYKIENIFSSNEIHLSYDLVDGFRIWDSSNWASVPLKFNLTGNELHYVGFSENEKDIIICDDSGVNILNSENQSPLISPLKLGGNVKFVVKDDSSHKLIVIGQSKENMNNSGYNTYFGNTTIVTYKQKKENTPFIYTKSSSGISKFAIDEDANTHIVTRRNDLNPYWLGKLTKPLQVKYISILNSNPSNQLRNILIQILNSKMEVVWEREFLKEENMTVDNYEDKIDTNNTLNKSIKLNLNTPIAGNYIKVLSTDKVLPQLSISDIKVSGSLSTSNLEPEKILNLAKLYKNNTISTRGELETLKTYKIREIFDAVRKESYYKDILDNIHDSSTYISKISPMPGAKITKNQEIQIGLINKSENIQIQLNNNIIKFKETKLNNLSLISVILENVSNGENKLEFKHSKLLETWNYLIPEFYNRDFEVNEEKKGLTVRIYNNETANNWENNISDYDISNYIKFPDKPDTITSAPYFEWPFNEDINKSPKSSNKQNYFIQMCGHITPTETSYYTFYISSDDGSKLLLSNNDQPSQIKTIAEQDGWRREKRDYTPVGKSKSKPIYLQKGTSYYIELRGAQGNGADSFSVSWRKEGIEGTPSLPISAKYLTQLDN